MQTLYATSGCDYTSFFYGYGKSTFFPSFSQNANFIVGKEVDFQNLSLDLTPNESLAAFYRLIRTIYYTKHRLAFMDHEALCLYWLHSYWTVKLWQSATDPKPEIIEPIRYGWSLDSGKIEIAWDSAENMEKIHQTVHLLLKGCSRPSSQCIQCTCKYNKAHQ